MKDNILSIFITRKNWVGALPRTKDNQGFSSFFNLWFDLLFDKNIGIFFRVSGFMAHKLNIFGSKSSLLNV